MYVRDAKNRDEVWLLNQLDESGLTDPAFRSRDYVIALDEETSEKAGFGRIRTYSANSKPVCELSILYTLERWRSQGVGAHVVERLLAEAGDEDFTEMYVISDVPLYFGQFGFEATPEVDLPEPIRTRLKQKSSSDQSEFIASSISISEFQIPTRLRERFKIAEPESSSNNQAQIEETAEDFGIDPSETTYKYETK
jgi:N-acetylglutamate synthase and related acetyltransferases